MNMQCRIDQSYPSNHTFSRRWHCEPTFEIGIIIIVTKICYCPVHSMIKFFDSESEPSVILSVLVMFTFSIFYYYREQEIILKLMP